MKKTLYKAGCDPFVATSQEQLDFHLTQGWVEDEKQLTAPAAKVVNPPPPSIVGKNDDKRVAALEAKIKELESASTDTQIKELNEIVAAKDVQIAEMQADFEELTNQMSAQINELKEQLAAATPKKR